jgi:hypothetical protein
MKGWPRCWPRPPKFPPDPAAAPGTGRPHPALLPPLSPPARARVLTAGFLLVVTAGLALSGFQSLSLVPLVGAAAIGASLMFHVKHGAHP